MSTIFNNAVTINIIGWYGTETLGDRAILDGIFSILNDVFLCKKNIKIGSLFPFYTERTFLEDKDLYDKTIKNAFFEIYDIKDRRIRKKEILESSLVIMGGGPLMDIDDLIIIKDSFAIAKKNNVKTCVLGCGIGPLEKKKGINYVKEIFQLSDLIILRDNISLNLANKLFNNKFNIKCFGDPAIISIENYKKIANKKPNEYAVINLREYPQNAYGGKSYFNDAEIIYLIKKMLNYVRKVYMIPMHTYFVGGDDRLYLEKIRVKINIKDVEVIHNPLCLKQLYEYYINAKMCVGMRYHSAVMQTILNGNNAIINYTGNNYGKIYGFIDMICGNNYYSKRTIDIHKKISMSDINKICEELTMGESYNYVFSNMKQNYIKELELLYEKQN